MFKIIQIGERDLKVLVPAVQERLGPYETYEGSPVSKGILQFDMWQKTPKLRPIDTMTRRGL